MSSSSQRPVVLDPLATQHLRLTSVPKVMQYLPLQKAIRKPNTKLTKQERREVCEEAANYPTLTQVQIGGMANLTHVPLYLLTKLRQIWGPPNVSDRTSVDSF